MDLIDKCLYPVIFPDRMEAITSKYFSDLTAEFMTETASFYLEQKTWFGIEKENMNTWGG